MRLFTSLYLRVIGWSRHRHATSYLFGLSFAESSFFPIPPDVLLAPMVLANRRKAWWLALLTTVASVAGGVGGYLIGWLLYNAVGVTVVEFYNAEEELLQIKAWFSEYGAWAILIAGFTPLPYKLFTISAGLLNMMLLPFIVASLVGRGARFYLVAGLIYWGGESLEKFIQTYVEWIGWAVVVLLVGAYVLFIL